MNAAYEFVKRNKELHGWDFGMIVDVGAHNGLWVRQMKELFPDARFLAIEANEDHAMDLCRTCGDSDSYEIALVGEEEGKEIPYYISESQYTTGNSIYPENTRHFENRVCVRKQITRLDSLFRKHNIESIDYLKLDIQGAELDALKSLGDYIDRVKFIQSEIMFLNYNEGAPSYTELLSYLHDKGFKVRKFLDIMVTNKFDILQMDLLFEREPATEEHQFIYTLDTISFRPAGTAPKST